MSIIFFDNDIDSVVDMIRKIPGVESIGVNDTLPNVLIKGLPGEYKAIPVPDSSSINEEKKEYDDYLVLYSKLYSKLYFNSLNVLYPDNTYIDFLKKFNYTKEPILPSNGMMKGVHMAEVANWINRELPNPKIAVFDWDRTITVVEGGIFPLDNEPAQQALFKPIKIEDQVCYLLGGTERVEAIKKMFKSLTDAQIPIFINTRNVASQDMKIRFLKVVQNIIPTFTEDYLIYTPPRSKKSEKLKENLKFKELTGGKYGGRRRKTHRQKRYRYMKRTRRSKK